jgi:hypothetical protein
MAHLYCPECGAKIEYSLQKPQFCSACGVPLDGKHASASKGKAPRHEDKEREEEKEFIPQISDLDVDIDYSFGKKFTFEELAETPKEELGRISKGKTKQSEDPIKTSMDDCLPGRRHSIG